MKYPLWIQYQNCYVLAWSLSVIQHFCCDACASLILQRKRAASREKVSNVLNLCHTKRRMGTLDRAWPSPSFFLYDTDFLGFFFGKDNLIFFWGGGIRCHTKRRMGVVMCAHPSFGMTIKDIRDYFGYQSPHHFVFSSTLFT